MSGVADRDWFRTDEACPLLLVPLSEEEEPPEEAMVASAEAPPQPRKPKDDPWTQQRVPSWRPLLTPQSVMAILFAIGAVAITIGLSIRSARRAAPRRKGKRGTRERRRPQVEANDVFQRKVQYDGDGTPDANSGCKIKDANVGTRRFPRRSLR